jgi:ABC-type uncharacterized transport system permease subunit
MKKSFRLAMYVLITLVGLWISYEIFKMVVDKYTSAVINGG